MKRILLLLALALPLIACSSKNDDNSPAEPSGNDSFPQHEGYRIYAVDETGWSTLYVYMYGSVNDLGGKWPGIKAAGTITVKGKKYSYFDVSVKEAQGKTEKLIFNDGGSAKIPASGEPSLSFGEKADYFFTVSSTAAKAFNGGSPWTVTVDEGPVSNATTKLQTFGASARHMEQIYQVNPKLYGASGAFVKIRDRLDEIHALGTDILYLMPIYEQGKLKAIGSPYCIKDFQAVNSSYGTLDELRAIVNTAHQKGMKVMFDWVANHTAWDCSWTSQHKDWYAQDSAGNITCPTADGTWSDVAQLNYDSQELRTAMTDALKYWVTELGIDGYRCDYAHGPTGSKAGPMDAFWKTAIAELRKLDPDLIMLAESDFTKMYDDGFDLIFSRAAKSRLISGFGSNLQSFFSTVATAFNNAPGTGSPLLFITNHDDATESTPVADFHGKEGARAAFLLMRSLPAATMMYGSQEIAYNAKINFFNVMTMSWTSEPEYRKSYGEAIGKIAAIDRTGALTVYTAGPVAILSYPTGTVAINTAGTEATATAIPAGLSGLTATELTLAPYEYKVY